MMHNTPYPKKPIDWDSSFARALERFAARHGVNQAATQLEHIASQIESPHGELRNLLYTLVDEIKAGNNVISGAETNGDDSHDPMPNPASLFWRVLPALAHGKVEVYLAQKNVIADRERAAKLVRQARVRTEFYEELDEVTA